MEMFYTEPIQNYLEGDGRRVSVEIYDDVVPGDCFLYIVGELKDDYQNISGSQLKIKMISQVIFDPTNNGW